MDQPRPFYCLFSVFSNKHYYIFTTNICPTSIQCRDLNPWSLEHESPPITTSPGLLPISQRVTTKINWPTYYFVLWPILEAERTWNMRDYSFLDPKKCSPFVPVLSNFCHGPNKFGNVTSHRRVVSPYDVTPSRREPLRSHTDALLALTTLHLKL